MKSKIVLVYLGNRGGGFQLLLDTVKDFVAGNFEVELLLSREAAKQIEPYGFDRIKITEYEILHRHAELLQYKKCISFFRSVYKLNRYAAGCRNTIFIQCMPSPMDTIVDRTLRIGNKNNLIVRCIHDPMAHVGERWPNKRAINSRLGRAHFVIFFSNFVKKSVILDTESVVCDLPNIFYSTEVPNGWFQLSSQAGFDQSKFMVTALGRIRTYKGLSALNNLCNEVHQKCNVVVAGEGDSSQISDSRVFLLNYWLEDSEFTSLVQLSDVFLFLYIEATQSGLIPVLISQGKTLVVSNAPGLMEQTANYNKVFHFDPLIEGDLNAALLRSLISLEKDNSELSAGNDRREFKIYDAVRERFL